MSGIKRTYENCIFFFDCLKSYEILPCCENAKNCKRVDENGEIYWRGPRKSQTKTTKLTKWRKIASYIVKITRKRKRVDENRKTGLFENFREGPDENDEITKMTKNSKRVDENHEIYYELISYPFTTKNTPCNFLIERKMCWLATRGLQSLAPLCVLA